MTAKKALVLANVLRKEVQRGFGKQVCKELDMDCASCQAQVLIGHINWYINSLENMIRQDTPKVDAKVKRKK